MNVLVTGAAGYIGSIVTEQLVQWGHTVVAVDNLQQGHRQAVPAEASFVPLDLCDPVGLEATFEGAKLDAVMHFAADALVGESMVNPARYYRNNVVCGLNLLNAMVKHRVSRLVFSSSCAVYGEPRQVPVSEGHPLEPVNPYGECKYVFERTLRWYAHAYGLTSVCLRYFNAAGASERFGEDHSPETHLIPNVLRVALGRLPQVSVFGTDYPTPDGSCIRDYVHVLDIAAAHRLALGYLHGSTECRAFNLGSGHGYSVLQVIDVARRITGAAVPTLVARRREGDPAVLVATSSLAEKELGWRPQYPELDGMIDSAWRWAVAHPGGYGGSGKA